MNNVNLSDYKQLPTVQAELPDLELNTLGVAQFIAETRHLFEELDEGDYVRVEVLGYIETNNHLGERCMPFVEGYYIGRIAEFDLDTGAATITLIRS